MSISAEQHYIFSVALKNLCEVGKIFGLTEEEILNPNAGKWMVDNYKQMLQVIKLSQNTRMLTNANQNIEAHNTAAQLPTENPLILDINKTTT